MQLTERSRVLVADPIRENRGMLVETLSSCGMSCIEAVDGVSAWRCFTADRPDLVLAALQLPGLTALDLLARIRDVSTTPFVVHAPAGEIPAAITAIRRGAADVIPFPCHADELSTRIKAALATNPERRRRTEAPESFAGRSQATSRIREQIRALAGLRIPVLFCGEKGTGRDHAVRCLAQLDGVGANDLFKVSPVTGRPLTRHEASKAIYIDEIERHSRVDQAYWCERISDSERAAQDAPRRVIVSTNSDLDRLSRRDEFDPKLAGILLRFVVNIPPLRARREDLIPLVESLGLHASRRIGRPNTRFTTPALKLLQQQTWPGNVSQLAALIEKLVAFSPDGLITRRLVSALIEEAPTGVPSLRRNALRLQRDELLAILDQTGGNLAEAARRMNMSRGAVIYRAQKFGLLAKRVRANP